MGNSGVNQKVAGNGILKENKKNWIEIPVFAALVAIASAVTFWLFYRQCVESMLGTGLYHSDMKVKCILWGFDDDGHTVDLDASGVREVDAREHIHKRSLSTAVFAQQ